MFCTHFSIRSLWTFCRVNPKLWLTSSSFASCNAFALKLIKKNCSNYLLQWASNFDVFNDDNALESMNLGDIWSYAFLMRTNNRDPLWWRRRKKIVILSVEQTEILFKAKVLKKFMTLLHWRSTVAMGDTLTSNTTIIKSNNH